LKRSVPYARRLRLRPAPRRELFSVPYLKEKAPVIELPVARWCGLRPKSAKARNRGPVLAPK
jgi:hypothetical protein